MSYRYSFTRTVAKLMTVIIIYVGYEGGSISKVLTQIQRSSVVSLDRYVFSSSSVFLIMFGFYDLGSLLLVTSNSLSNEF